MAAFMGASTVIFILFGIEKFKKYCCKPAKSSKLVREDKIPIIQETGNNKITSRGPYLKVNTPISDKNGQTSTLESIIEVDTSIIEDPAPISRNLGKINKKTRFADEILLHK